MHVPKLKSKILQVFDRFSLLYCIPFIIFYFCYLIQSLYKCRFNFVYLFTFADGDMFCCFGSFVLVYWCIFVFCLLERGQAPSPDLIPYQLTSGISQQFLRATAYMLWRVYAMAILSVCPSVRLSVTRVDQSKRLKLGSCNFHHTVAPSL